MLLLGQVVGAVPSGLLLCWINHLVGRQGGNKGGDVERGVEGWEQIKSRTWWINKATKVSIPTCQYSRGREEFNLGRASGRGCVEKVLWHLLSSPVVHGVDSI